MRALVVGLGSIGRRHARNWAALGLGPVDICRQSRRPQPEPLGIAAREFTDLDAALAERPDVVLVTNPTSLHVATACRAVRAGAHVLIEKPIGHELAGVADLLQEARQRHRQLMVGYNLRFHPGVVRLKELLRSDAGIGPILSARADVGEYLPDWHPWEDYRQSYAGRHDLGGGALLTFSHELDALCWLLGPPSRLTAIADHVSALDVDAEDVAEVLLQFPTGAIGSVHLDYVSRAPRRTLELIGERGTLRWDYHANRLQRYSADTRQWRVEEGDLGFERNQMYLAELAHFARCARGEIEQPLIDGAQGAAVLALALAARRSASDGRTIDLSQEGAPTTTWLTSLGQS